MARILLVESKTIIKELLQKIITLEFKVDMCFASDARDAIDRLKNEKFDLIISRDVIDKQRTGSSLINFKKKKACAPLLILGEDFSEVDNVEKLPIPYEEDDLLSKVHTMLSNYSGAPEKGSRLPYIGYELNFFREMGNTPCDLFLRVTRASGAHYVKRFHKGDVLDPDVIEKYINDKKIKQFYVASTDRRLIFAKVIHVCFDAIVKTKANEVHLDMNKQSNNFGMVQDIITKFGITEETIRISDQMIKKMKQNVKTFNKLNEMLQEVLAQPSSYNFKRSYLVLLFAGHILPFLKWSGKKHFEIILEKMSYVCFFHDIYLKEEKHLKISNKIDLYQSDLSEEEKELIHDHAAKSAELLSRYQGLPSGVDLIIKQHHGTTNGHGFTDYYKANISHMAILFIILEEFVGHLLTYNEHKKGLVQILKEMERKFELPSYHRIVEALKESMIKARQAQQAREKASQEDSENTAA